MTYATWAVFPVDRFIGMWIFYLMNVIKSNLVHVIGEVAHVQWEPKVNLKIKTTNLNWEETRNHVPMIKGTIVKIITSSPRNKAISLIDKSLEINIGDTFYQGILHILVTVGGAEGNGNALWLNNWWIGIGILKFRGEFGGVNIIKTNTSLQNTYTWI